MPAYVRQQVATLPKGTKDEGFNEGWIDFDGDETSSLKGETALEAVFRPLVEGQGKKGGKQ